jgi:cytochrome b561
MPLKNTKTKFGSITKLLHWLIAILFILQYYLVYRRPYFPKDAPEKLQYILLHKSVGVLVLCLALLMLIWRQVGNRPTMPPMNRLMHFVANATHVSLYFVMLFMPISGIWMSIFGGRAVSFFGLFSLPMIVSKNEGLSQILYTAHLRCAYFVMAIVGLHLLAAFYHHFIKRDNVLTRMLPFSK